MLELEYLLRSLSDDEPSGANLEYDPEFTALELAAQPGEERQVGDSIILAHEPDFKAVAEMALGVLARSHDLRVAVLLAQARLRLQGLPGFASVTGYIRGCLERYWESCHPQLDADDDNDATMRMNAVVRLTDLNTILRGVRLAPLTESRAFGRITLRDLAVAAGEMPASADMTAVPDSNTISAAFQDTDPARLQELLVAARAALADVKAIGDRFDEMVPGNDLDLDPLMKLLKQASTKLAAAAGVEAEASDAEADAGSAAPARSLTGGMVRGGGGAPGSIASQADVVAALERIVGYYQNYEPSSPLPILLERAKRLVGADFLTIMKDMAPAGMDNVELIGGIGNSGTDDA